MDGDGTWMGRGEGGHPTVDSPFMQPPKPKASMALVGLISSCRGTRTNRQSRLAEIWAAHHELPGGRLNDWPAAGRAP